MSAGLKTLAAALAAGALLAAGAGAATPALPQLSEGFGPKPCPKTPKTTLQKTNCAKNRILRSDKEINKRRRTVWALLKTAAPRTRFANAERAWLVYRGTNCRSRSDVVKTASLATLESVTCTGDLNRQHARELRRFESDLRKR